MGNFVIIEKKVWPEYFELIDQGKKNFELRLADFDCKEGDELLLKEWDPQKREYTGREMVKKVTCVLKMKDVPPFFTKEEIDQYGYQIISFRPEE